MGVRQTLDPTAFRGQILEHNMTILTVLELNVTMIDVLVLYPQIRVRLLVLLDLPNHSKIIGRNPRQKPAKRGIE